MNDKEKIIEAFQQRNHEALRMIDQLKKELESLRQRNDPSADFLIELTKQIKKTLEWS
jgi:cell division septum initiation protein DivIVA